MKFCGFGWRWIVALAVALAALTIVGSPARFAPTAALAQDEPPAAPPPAPSAAAPTPVPAKAAPEASPAPSGEAANECPDGKVRVNFNDTDIKDIVKTMATMTHQNFLIDKAVTGTITIISTTCVTPEQAYDMFLSILYVNGMTTVKVGQLTKIIKRTDAQTQPIQTNLEGLGRANEKYVTQLIPLKNIDAVDIAGAFRPLISQDGNVFAYGPSNMLIILDSAANIDRLAAILKKLDVEGTEQLIEVVPVEYASAETIAEVVVQLFEDQSRGTLTGGGAGPFSQLRQRLQQQQGQRPAMAAFAGQRPGQPGGANTTIAASEQLRIIPDARTNSLVVKASKFTVKRVREVVAKLDQPLPGGEGKIHVVYLENADATDLAGILADLAGTGGAAGANQRRPGQTGQGGQFGRPTQAGGAASAFASRFGGSSFGGASGGLGTASAGLGQGGINRGQQGNPTRSIAQTSGRFLADFEGAVRITADPATNSLVIIASNRDMDILREVIAKLDIPRPQVYVEVLIAEITASRGLTLGFEFRSTNNETGKGVQVIGGTNYGGIQSAATNPLGLSGFSIGAMDGTITYNGQTYPNIGALFQAMQTDTDVNIVATPHLLTTDNQQAQVVIADNIPFITGTIYSNSNTAATQTIERQDVGITLQITPSINESDMVRLTIYTESSSVTDSPAGLSASQVGVTTAKRTADTVVVVKSRQTVVIGGLMKDNISYSESKVPVFGDIPVLGYLFKNSKRQIDKTNLLFFITPYIIKDQGDLEEVTRRSNYRLQQFRQQNRMPVRHDVTEDRMSPHESIFRPQESSAIEIDPTKRGGAPARPAEATPEPNNAPASNNSASPPAPNAGSSGGGPSGQPADPDFGGRKE